MCVCTAVCPDETQAWVRCFRSVVRKQRSSSSAHEDASGANCEHLRNQLEQCTAAASSRLLHAAVMPSDREAVHHSVSDQLS